jgi:mannose-6-phosphate isomerase
MAIGESWEFSCEPAFPSRLAGRPGTLSDAFKALGQPEAQILVKLLNAAEPLSLQLHPTDDDPALKPGECGKPESWLVLDAEPGAGIYLGFSRAVSREELRRAIEAGGGAVRDLLHLEVVRPGDYFEIEPGVTHSIGPGVTLLEPQRVLAGKNGVTLRLWDWDRRYDRNGQPDPAGEPRALHVDAGLRLADPERQVGAAFAASLKKLPVVSAIGGFSVGAYPANRYYQTLHVRAAAGARAMLRLANGYAAVVTLTGDLQFGPTRLRGGEPGLLPPQNTLVTAVAPSEFALVLPASATVHWETP